MAAGAVPDLHRFGSIGTGEWVMGPQAAAQYRGALFIVVLLAAPQGLFGAATARRV